MYVPPGLTKDKFVSPFTSVSTSTQGNVATQDLVVSEPKLRALAKVAETFLRSVPAFECRSDIGSAKVKFITDDPHLARQWQSNWFACGRDAKTDFTVFAAVGMENRETGIFFGSAASNGVLFNTDYYGSVRTVAVLFAQRKAIECGGLILTGAAVTMEGRGTVVLVGPSLEHVVRCAVSLASRRQAALSSCSLAGIRLENEVPRFAGVEKCLYLPGKFVRTVEGLGMVLNRADTENAVWRFEDCVNKACLQEVADKRFECVFHRGYDGCIWSQPASSILFDPGWFSHTFERSLESDLIGLAVVLGQESGETGCVVEPVSPESAGQRLAGVANKCDGKPEADFRWLVPSGSAPNKEVVSFLDRIEGKVPLAFVRLAPGAEIEDAESFFGAFERLRGIE